MYRIVFAMAGCAVVALASGFQSSDFLKLRSVGSVQFSPDGARLAYSITRNYGPGRPFGQIWIMTLAEGKFICLSSGKESSGNLEWSPDGKWISYSGRLGDKSGLIVAPSNGSEPKYLGPLDSTNAPLPTTGRTTAWSPDSTQIAYVSATAGPETADATGDPIVITRYLYKPTAAEGNTHFNDNKRLHIFVVDVATGKSRQLTSGVHYEHSIDWSPDGREIAYISNRAPDDDRFFTYDLFTLSPSTGETRQVTATESAEYRPHYSPDGKSIVYEATKRGLTDRETTMEDTHVWLIDANGKNRHEVGGELDARQGEPQYSSDGRWIYFTAQERGEVHLYRVAAAGGKAEAVVKERGSVGSFSTHGDLLAYTMATPSDQAELYLKSGGGPARQLTDVNHDALAGKTIEPVEAFTFVANDNKWTVEAFLTYPAGFRADRQYPLIVDIHGGPHGQQGPMFNWRSQVYASRGWATIMV